MVNISKYRPFPAYESHEEAQSDHCLSCHNSYRGALVKEHLERRAPMGCYFMHCLHCFNFVLYDLIEEVEQAEKYRADVKEILETIFGKKKTQRIREKACELDVFERLLDEISDAIIPKLQAGKSKSEIIEYLKSQRRKLIDEINRLDELAQREADDIDVGGNGRKPGKSK